jgi:hypothetical protein
LATVVHLWLLLTRTGIPIFINSRVFDRTYHDQMNFVEVFSTLAQCVYLWHLLYKFRPATIEIRSLTVRQSIDDLS